VNRDKLTTRRLAAGAIALSLALAVVGAASGHRGGPNSNGVYERALGAPHTKSPNYYCMIEQRRRRSVRAHSLRPVALAPQCGGGGGSYVVPYWGFNYLTGARPNYYDCPWEQFRENGIACSGWNYWDVSQIDKRNGGYIALGFCNNGGDHIHCYSTGSAGGTGIIWISRIAVNNYYDQCCGIRPIPTYNKVYCDYAGGNQSYGQCQAVRY
jgi:hypothetical protein